MTVLYVLDTETSTSSFRDGEPNGHIVEIGIARVDTTRREITPYYVGILNDPDCEGTEWVFQNTDLSVEDVRNGEMPKSVDRYLASLLEGCIVTSYNRAFDRTMMRRDLPLTSNITKWAPCLMLAAAEIEDIPRNHAGTGLYPTAEASYNYLCPDDPRHLNGKERHRALSDAMMEAHILLALIERGAYPLKGEDGE